MTEKERELLLKDLGERMFHGVIVVTNNKSVKTGVVSGVSTNGKVTVSTEHADIVFDCEDIKPYLRSLDDMTEEENTKWFECYYGAERAELNAHGDYFKAAMDGEIAKYEWLRKNRFNYMLPDHLFIRITEENNPYK